MSEERLEFTIADLHAGLERLARPFVEAAVYREASDLPWYARLLEWAGVVRLRRRDVDRCSRETAYILTSTWLAILALTLEEYEDGIQLDPTLLPAREFKIEELRVSFRHTWRALIIGTDEIRTVLRVFAREFQPYGLDLPLGIRLDHDRGHWRARKERP